MKKLILFILFIFITTTLFATDWYVSKRGDDSNDGLSWDSPLLSPDYAYDTCTAGDTIHIGQGVYEFKNNITYELEIDTYYVTFVGIGKVIFEGKGKDVTTNNTFMSPVTSFTYLRNNFLNIEFTGFFSAITFRNIAHSPAYFYSCVFKDNKNGVGNSFDGTYYLYLGYIDKCVFTGNEQAIAMCDGSIVSYNTFYNDSCCLIHPYKATTNVYNNNVVSCTYFVNQYGSNIGRYESNNFYNVTTIFYNTSTNIYNINATYLNPLFNDSNFTNPVLTLRRNSPLRSLNVGAYGVADYSTKNDTNTWSEWYSWITETDSTQVYNDSCFVVDTASGLTLQYGNDYAKNRRVTRVFSNLGTLYGVPLKVFSNQLEIFNTGDYSNYWAVIDYDTTTEVREFRYMASNDIIPESDLQENSGQWILYNSSEDLPEITCKYFAVELFFRYNF